MCRNHLKENLIQDHIDEYTIELRKCQHGKRKNKLFEWSVNLHNIVNKSIDKPAIDLETAYNIYKMY